MELRPFLKGAATAFELLSHQSSKEVSSDWGVSTCEPTLRRRKNQNSRAKTQVDSRWLMSSSSWSQSGQQPGCGRPLLARRSAVQHLSRTTNHDIYCCYWLDGRMFNQWFWFSYKYFLYFNFIYFYWWSSDFVAFYFFFYQIIYLYGLCFLMFIIYFFSLHAHVHVHEAHKQDQRLLLYMFKEASRQ